MAIKVRHRKSDKVYIYLGAGYGMFKSSLAGNWIQSFSPETDEGEAMMVAVCTAKGEIRWGKSRDFVVIEVDGHDPAKLLEE